MGTVWRAYDLALQREVALKEVRPSDSPDPDSSRARMMRERVLREARALARLDHPNVVTIHHIVDTPALTHPWIVMELVRGRSLADRLTEGPMAPVEAARLGRGTLAALRTAHQAGICHRDVKPANVLLRPDGSPVLTDFGIAAMLDSPGLTASGDVVGSPEYIAPERLRGHEGDPASDLWSLGMLLYVAVEGRHPLRRDTPIATLAAVLNGQVPPPYRAGPLANVLHALLTSDPGARPPVAELDRMLARAEEQAATAPPPPSFTPHPFTPPPAGSMPSGPMPSAPMPSGPMASGPVPPGGGHATGPGRQHAYTGLPTEDTKRRSGGRRAATIAGMAAVGGVVAAALIVVPRLQDRVTPDLPGTTSTPVRTKPGATEPAATEPADANPDKPANLLTPAGVRTAISALEKASRGRRFTGLTVYEDFAIAQVAVPAKKGYDTYTYRDGQVIRATGGPLSPDAKPFTARSFDWDSLPKLRQYADRRLGVKKPTTHYVIAQGAWVFANNQPVILFYVGDEYGTGYLAADTNGRVLKTYAR
ncbi:serine/threonine protein kinase [Nonomuraea rhodomycinica]|uniref:non-specific serine/threonine protein kinase n=2 Tax=Nonomuraea rhodomycinica TaxID=1712872 RepID=A0A7Y6IY91_9ACTN|nr:serine/threonine protein kinase [Nonomuraea rhodomycinica]